MPRGTGCRGWRRPAAAGIVAGSGEATAISPGASSSASTGWLPKGCAGETGDALAEADGVAGREAGRDGHDALLAVNSAEAGMCRSASFGRTSRVLAVSATISRQCAEAGYAAASGAAQLTGPGTWRVGSSCCSSSRRGAGGCGAGRTRAGAKARPAARQADGHVRGHAAIAERHPQDAPDLPARERIIGRRGQEGPRRDPVPGAARPRLPGVRTNPGAESAHTA